MLIKISSCVWAQLYQLLTTEASLRPDAQEHQRTETLSPKQAERNRQGGNCILTTPYQVHFHFSIPLSYVFESQESMGASCRLCRCLFDAFTADFLKWIPNEPSKHSVLSVQGPSLDGWWTRTVLGHSMFGLRQSNKTVPSISLISTDCQMHKAC